jgi:hypothetical protein
MCLLTCTCVSRRAQPAKQQTPRSLYSRAEARDAVSYEVPFGSRLNAGVNYKRGVRALFVIACESIGPLSVTKKRNNQVEGEGALHRPFSAVASTTRKWAVQYRFARRG